jgi:ABC-type multidrug transport system fused ATPase/permease subunit
MVFRFVCLLFACLLVCFKMQVGSGKTMLLEALLGGSPYLITSNQLMSESIGFVPQETLVVSGSVRENVLMGRPYNEARLNWAISAACMERS